MSKSKAVLAEEIIERDKALNALRDMYPPGSLVKTMLRHVSRSGMMRAISVISPDVEDISWQVARAGGWQFNSRHGGVTVNGCGMDMGFHLVYSLSRSLYPNGFECIGDGCPSNDHSNGDRDYTVGHVVHSDGGYALRNRWI